MYATLAEPLVRGYAVANTDTGHQGGMGDFTWAPGHPEKLTDYQHRAVHELTRVGKDITAVHYGKAPEKSYWYGCSTGGRQGLKEALKYPADYDAIIAGAPANHLMALVTLTAMIPSELNASGLDAEKLSLLKEAAIAKCDTADGIADRVISDPQSCSFDPASLVCNPGETENCLSVTAADAAKRLYAGLVDEAGNELFPGTGPGSEMEWAATQCRHSAWNQLLPERGVWGSAWQFTRANAAADLARRKNRMQAPPRPWTRTSRHSFARRQADPLSRHVRRHDSLAQHRQLLPKLGGRLGAEAVDENVRLYLVPSMDHCSGGEGPFNVDWLTALEEWSEGGKAPGALLGSHPAEIPGAFGAPARPSKAYTRPVCPYPQIAKYKGDGLPSDAANFQCSGP
jgi:feruloyl esterase